MNFIVENIYHFVIFQNFIWFCLYYLPSKFMHKLTFSKLRQASVVLFRLKINKTMMFIYLKIPALLLNKFNFDNPTITLLQIF